VNGSGRGGGIGTFFGGWWWVGTNVGDGGYSCVIRFSVRRVVDVVVVLVRMLVVVGVVDVFIVVGVIGKDFDWGVVIIGGVVVGVVGHVVLVVVVLLIG